MMDRIILAGVFSRSNMGQEVPLQMMERAIRHPPKTVQASSLFFCQDLMETNADERAFEKEAKSWYRELSKMSDEKIAKIWPDIHELYLKAGGT
jgi:hypothetical protein